MSVHAFRDDLPGYALSALPDEEVAALETHLEQCAECRRELADLCTVTAALATSVPPQRAPVALRGRIMTTVSAEAELLGAAGPEADRPARRRRTWTLGSLSIRPLGAFAGVAAILIAAVLGATLGDRGASSSSHTFKAQTFSGAGPRAQAQVEVTKSRATLHVTHFVSPGKGRVYQVWLKAGKDEALRATPEVFTVGRDGTGAAELPAAARHAYRVLVTSELAGGSPSGQPTRAPVLQTSL